jgi:hypothetical protein
MSLINEKTSVIAVPELDIFVTPPCQTSIEKTFMQEIRPVSLLNTGGHIEFLINTDYLDYLRLNETTLHAKFRVSLTKKDKSVITNADWVQVSMTNNILHSLWSQVDLYIENVQTTVSLQTYPYRSYFETILYSNNQSRKTYLPCEGYFDDEEPENFKALTKKYQLISKSANDVNVSSIIDLTGKLHLDIMQQPNYLMNSMRLKLILIPHKPEFIFYTHDANIIPKIEFQELYITVYKSRVNEELYLAHQRAIEYGPAKYPITRSEVRSVTIDKGVSSRNLENVVNGQLPRRVFIAFVENDAFTGAFTKNAFNFANFNISSLACYVNGDQYPKRAYKPNFSENLYTREYLDLLNTISQYNNDVKTVITKDKFKNGFTIFGFDLARDLSDGYHQTGYVDIPRNGVLRFEIQFGEQLTTTINAIIYCEFDNMITVNGDRNVFIDFH